MSKLLRIEGCPDRDITGCKWCPFLWGPTCKLEERVITPHEMVHLGTPEWCPLPSVGERIPAEVFHLGELLQEEMRCRNWGLGETAVRMGGDSWRADRTWLKVFIRDQPDIPLGEYAEKLSVAFGLSAEFFERFHEAWRRYRPRRASVLVGEE